MLTAAVLGSASEAIAVATFLVLLVSAAIIVSSKRTQQLQQVQADTIDALKVDNDLKTQQLEDMRKQLAEAHQRLSAVEQLVTQAAKVDELRKDIQAAQEAVQEETRARFEQVRTDILAALASIIQQLSNEHK